MKLEELTVAELIQSCHVTEPLTDPEKAMGAETWRNWETLKRELQRRQKAFYDGIRIPETGLFSKIRVPLVDFWEEILDEEALTGQEAQIVKEIQDQLREERNNNPAYQEKWEAFLKESREHQFRLQQEENPET